MKRIFFFLTAILAVFAVSSCEKQNDEWATGEARPLSLTKAQIEYVKNGNTFACKMLGLIDEKQSGKDFFFSPLSVQMTLSMLLNGTDGAAFQELCSVLGYGDDLESVNNFCQQMIERSPTWDPKVKLAIANALVGNNRYTFKDPYVKTLKSVFSAEVSIQDFSQTNQVIKDINDWSNSKTHGMIPRLLDYLDPNAALCLMNALYFKGEWLAPFDKSKTTKEAFHLEGGKTINVNMMNKVLSMPYSSGTNWHSLVLPYGNRSFSLHIILPKGDATVKDIISEIQTTGWSGFATKLYSKNVSLKLPQFETEYSEQEFARIIAAAGAKKIFEGGCFSSISNDQINISAVIHKAKIKVNEEGTEAAAATVMTGWSSPGKQEPIEFYCDRPFLYAIVEESTGAIFFMGKYGAN